MEINIKNETLPVCSAVFRTANNFSSECDIIVPDSKPDILKVLQLSARPRVTSCEIRNGHIIVNGIICFDILYLADNEERCLKSITSSCEFSNLVRDSNISESMLTFTDVEVSDLVCTVANCRKISLRASLLLNACVYSCRNLEIITEIEGACTKKAEISSDIICAHAQDTAVITDSFTLSPDKLPISEILKTDASVTQSSLKVIDNKAILKGTLRVTVLYKCENSVTYGQTEITFAHILEADGIREDMKCEYNIKLTDISAAATADSDGNLSVIDLSARLDMRVIARKNERLSSVTDAYIPHGAIDFKTAPISVDSVDTVLNREADFKEKVTLPETLPPIETVYQVIARPFTESCISSGDKLHISGYTEVYLLYLSGDSSTPACSHKANIDFEVECDSPDCSLTPMVSCKIQNLSYTIENENTVELRGNIDIKIECVKTLETEIIYDVEVSEYVPRERPSIIISCVHSGRTLWDIAKEYLVTPEAILVANAVESEKELGCGKALIIPK